MTERVSQEMNTRTRDLTSDLKEHITQTNNDIVAEGRKWLS